MSAGESKALCRPQGLLFRLPGDIAGCSRRSTSALGYTMERPGRKSSIVVLLPQNPLERVRGEAPPPSFPMGFVVGGDGLDHQN
jgi:hypothetical protein